MWFFTTEGFYSAVIQDRGKHAGEIVVRARETGALELLRKRYMPELSETSHRATSDYRYRAWISREDFAAGMARVAMEVDYPNFKSEVAKKRGLGRFEKALHEVWSVMGKLQPAGPYGYGGKGYPAVPKGESTRAPGKPWTAQQSLPTELTPCEDCGEMLEPEDGVVFGSRWLCKNVGACNDRLRAQRGKKGVKP